MSTKAYRIIAGGQIEVGVFTPGETMSAEQIRLASQVLQEDLGDSLDSMQTRVTENYDGVTAVTSFVPEGYSPQWPA